MNGDRSLEMNNKLTGMKKFLFALLLFTACKKSGSNKMEIVIREPVSGTPVQGATVTLIRCNFGCPFGGTTLFNEQTDANGKVYVSSSAFSDASGGMAVEKSKYWPVGLTTPAVAVSLTPEGWLRIRILKGGNYPAAANLKIVTHNQTGDPLIDTREFSLANDSSILVRGFGGQLNKLDWQVSDNLTVYNSGTFNQQVPRLDTVKNITLNY
jgi:hypothetical protein